MPVDLSGGVPPSREDVLVAAPSEPDFRESVNIWLQDDHGRFSFPRIGVEAVAKDWGRREIQANIAFPSGRVLLGSCEGDAVGPYDVDGRPAVIGGGPIRFTCKAPFDRWSMEFRGPAVTTTIAEQSQARDPNGPSVDVEIRAELTMVVPPWVQGQLSDEARALLEDGKEAQFIGGARYEQLFRATGTFRAGQEEMDFSATGLRIHRQGVRHTDEFWGHCWQSAVFPSGRAFGYMAFPDSPDGKPSYQEGFVFDGERMLPARVRTAPWLTTFEPHGGDVSCTLESELGLIEIRAVTHTSTAIAGAAQFAKIEAARSTGVPQHDLFFHQGSAMYTWDGESSHGMIERSLPSSQVAR